MGTITMESAALLASITEDSLVDDGCSGVRTITVNVPAGTTKFVKFTVSDAFCDATLLPIGLEETIGANKQYNLAIDGDDTTTSVNSQITISVYQYDGGPLDAFDTYSRMHSGAFC